MTHSRYPFPSKTLTNIAIFNGVLLSCLIMANTAWAADKAPVNTQALAKASQNPVANMISLPFENNATFNNGDDDVYINIMNIKPVVPMKFGENWNLINRAIIPVAYRDDGFMGQHVSGGTVIGRGEFTDLTTPANVNDRNSGSSFGLGDITYQGFFSPAKTGKIIWGLGPQINIPTGTDSFTADQWSLGPAAVVLTMPGHWVIGALVSNVWNIGNGYDDAPDVNTMTLQPFVNYNMDDGWYLVSAPVMTANWEADSGDEWTIPMGGGLGRVFKIGSQHVNVRLAGYYNVDATDGNDDVFNLQFMWTFLFPKGK